MGNDAKTVRDSVLAGHKRLIATFDGLTDADLRAPSALPDWSRGHVLTHLEHNAKANVRQVEYALAGKLIEFYDGGRPAAATAVTAGSSRSAAEIRAAVVESADQLEEAWNQVDDWDRVVRYRNGTLRDLVFGRWREVEIHMADLDLGYRSSDWAPDFCVHAVSFLGARTPKGVELTVNAGGHQWKWGTGTPAEVSGELTEVAAWLAGRAHRLPGELPELGLWP
jgi:maleylpyruvate isomerase